MFGLATQLEQDAEDEMARKQAMKNLVNSWQERLQLISVITTFFATSEAGLMVNTKPAGSEVKASNTALLGALILHVCASVLSFLGAFLLIRYKLKEATREEVIAESITTVDPPLDESVTRVVEPGHIGLGLQQTHTKNANAQSTMRKSLKNDMATLAPTGRSGSYPVEPPILSSNPHIEQVGPFGPSVPSHLLDRTHALCVFLAAAGFILAIVGVLCYAWATQPREVRIFASICLGGAVFTTVILFVRMSPVVASGSITSRLNRLTTIIPFFHSR
ncbi:hypothetical protein HD554DRAFT_1672924 [Boletus coccyginus]|nr:hypothetical protein HD554DRAFT_1672924 [Boletus coccyginus]